VDAQTPANQAVQYGANPAVGKTFIHEGNLAPFDSPATLRSPRGRGGHRRYCPVYCCISRMVPQLFSRTTDKLCAADTVVCVDDEILGKPSGDDDASGMLGVFPAATTRSIA
jgi:hypothetical protein